MLLCEPADKPGAQADPRVQQCTSHLQVREGGAQTFPPVCSSLKIQDVQIQSSLVYKNHCLTADVLSSFFIIPATLDLVQ